MRRLRSPGFLLIAAGLVLLGGIGALRMRGDAVRGQVIYTNPGVLIEKGAHDVAVSCSGGPCRLAYFTSPDNTLTFARCNDNTCSAPVKAATQITVPGQILVKRLACEGSACRMFFVNPNGDATIYWCANADCSSGQAVTVPLGTGFAGADMDCANGLCHFVASIENQIRLYRCTQTDCTRLAIGQTDEVDGTYPSISCPSGSCRVSWKPSGWDVINYFVCRDYECSIAEYQAVGDGEFNGLGGKGYGTIRCQSTENCSILAMHDSLRMLLQCTNSWCSNPVRSQIDDTGPPQHSFSCGQGCGLYTISKYLFECTEFFGCRKLNQSPLTISSGSDFSYSDAFIAYASTLDGNLYLHAFAGYGLAVCGNGQTEGVEQCDDGNFVNGDGCSDQCRLEAASSSSQNCTASCPDGFQYQTCDKNGNPITWYTDPCEGHGGSSSAAAPASSVFSSAAQSSSAAVVSSSALPSSASNPASSNPASSAAPQSSTAPSSAAASSAVSNRSSSSRSSSRASPVSSAAPSSSPAIPSSAPASSSRLSSAISSRVSSAARSSAASVRSSSRTSRSSAATTPPLPPPTQPSFNPASSQASVAERTESSRQAESLLAAQPYCGDGALDAGEECDDGNTSNLDRCTVECLLARCGDRSRQAGEQCDDGNALNGDGCSAGCVVERAPILISNVISSRPASRSSAHAVVSSARASSVKTSVCGDRVRDADEQCDDGNRIAGDGCSDRCALEACGNGTIDAGESCDRGSLNSNAPDAACRPDCTFGRCGDSVRDTSEQCDDGNRIAGDGCDGSCRAEAPLQQALPAALTQAPLFLQMQPALPAETPPAVQPQIAFQLPLQNSPAQTRPAAGAFAPQQPQTAESGPGALAVMAAGGAAGYAWMRRRRAR